jgi:hypothetical protein
MTKSPMVPVRSMPDCKESTVGSRQSGRGLPNP